MDSISTCLMIFCFGVLIYYLNRGGKVLVRKKVNLKDLSQEQLNELYKTNKSAIWTFMAMKTFSNYENWFIDYLKWFKNESLTITCTTDADLYLLLAIKSSITSYLKVCAEKLNHPHKIRFLLMFNKPEELYLKMFKDEIESLSIHYNWLMGYKQKFMDFINKDVTKATLSPLLDPDFMISTEANTRKEFQNFMKNKGKVA